MKKKTKNNIYLSLAFVSTLFLIYICLSAPKTVTPSWKARLIRPDGEVHRSYVIKSKLIPKSDLGIGGQIALYSDNGNGVWGYEKTGCVAPSGWAWDIIKLKGE